MAKTKPIPTCKFQGCKEKGYLKDRGRWDRFCRSHSKKCTIDRFLGYLYSSMKRRVNGKGNVKNPHLYTGLPILTKEAFVVWAKNHPDFLNLYKCWVANDFDRKLTPSVNRMNSKKGYILGNIEWMTTSQNCALASGARSMKQKKVIYDILGVINGKK